jgi:hypothetical protein
MRQTPLWRRYQRLWGSDPAADTHDEVEFHIEMRVADLVRRGLSEPEARNQARREFGDVSRICAEMNAHALQGTGGLQSSDNGAA